MIYIGLKCDLSYKLSVYSIVCIENYDLKIHLQQSISF